MPTINGPWSSDGRVRLVCEYTVNMNSSETQGTFDADILIETKYSMYDSVNSYSISGGLGSASGSFAISHSTGKKSLIKTMRGTKTGNTSISATVSGLEAVSGGKISASFTLLMPETAPRITSFSYRNLQPTSFVADILSYSDNGTPNKTQVQWNTSASTSGADAKDVSGFNDILVSGLAQNKTYYFRMRIATVGYGWGPWTSWKSVKTPADTPNTPRSNWYITGITQTDARVAGMSVSDDGGSAVTEWGVQYNTSKSTSGAKTRNSGSANTGPTLIGLEPNTKYYARIRARNKNGWGDYTDWKAFTTASGILVLHNGVWRTAVPYVKYAGVWRRADIFVRHNGVWR